MPGLVDIPRLLMLSFACLTAVFNCGSGVAAESSASTTVRSDDEQKVALAVDALMRLQNVDLEQNARLKETVYKLLDKTQGKPDFVRLVQHFHLPNQDDGLLDVAIRNSTNETGVVAIRLVLANKELELVERTLRETNSDAALRLSTLLGQVPDRLSVKLLAPLAQDASIDSGLRRQSVRSLARTAEGASEILSLAKVGKLPEDVKFTAGAELSRARWPEIKQQAAQLLPLPAGKNSQPLPPVAELLKMEGNVASGAALFTNLTISCSTCHRVRGQGVDFGPDLSEVGTKLGRDALFEAILEPSAGISFGFEAWQIELKSGEEAYGLIASDSADELALKAVGGIVTRYKKADIAKREQMKLSIMPAGLQQNMTTQELVDLVEYLSSLKKQ